MPVGRRWRDRPAEVTMDQLKGLCRVVLRRLRERHPSLLPGQAAVTQLACVLDVR